MTVLNLASERCVATDEICVKGGSGMFPRQAIYRLLRDAGAYKFCTGGYRRALLAKYVFTWSLFSSQSKALCEAVNPLICRKLYS